MVGQARWCGAATIKGSQVPHLAGSFAYLTERDKGAMTANHLLTGVVFTFLMALVVGLV